VLGPLFWLVGDTTTLKIRFDDAHADFLKFRFQYSKSYQNLFDACTSILITKEWNADATATELIKNGRIPPVIIVGIDNAGNRDRPKRYLPYPDKHRKQSASRAGKQT